MNITGKHIRLRLALLSLIFFLALAGMTLAQDLTISNLTELADMALSANYSLYIPWTPWQIQAYPTDNGEPWWVDCSQVACADLLSTSTNSCATLQMHGVTVTFATLTKNILTGETLLYSGCSTDVIASIEAPSGYDPNTQLGYNAWVWRQWQEVTNCLDCWGLVAGEIPPPIVTLKTRLADASQYSIYSSNVEADAAAAAAAWASAFSSFTTGGRFTAMDGGGMMLMDDEDSCTITDETSAFGFTEIEMETNGCDLTWGSCSDHVYILQAESSLMPTSSWVDIAWMWGDDGATTYLDTNAVGLTQEFYRVVRASPDQLNNGIPYGWAVDNGLDPLDPNLAWADPDGDGYDNWQEYEAGTDPRDPNSHPNNMLTIPNAWATYTATNSVLITANVLSTNAVVNVKAAEYFLDAINGTNGAGTAMSATNSAFNSTNVTAVATFTPIFTNGERHVIYLHAEGSDNQWTPFKQVIINPNANDVLNKVKANYSQISDITYTLTRYEYFEGQITSTNTVLYRQQGPSKMRWDNETTGAITIINGTEVDVIDESGQLTPFTLVATSGGNDQPLPMGQFFWDMDQFTAQHTLGAVTSSTNGPASYVVNASPNSGTGLPYDAMSCEVDFRYGVVTSFNFNLGGETETTVQQAQPQEVASGVWFHSQQTCIEPLTTNWNMQFTENFQTNSIQINSGTVSNQLFQVTGP